MSLDVTLTLPSAATPRTGTGIFIRENGRTKEITRAEWDEKFPGPEPVMPREVLVQDGTVFDRNITHNLNAMAGEAGIYKHLWRPEELGITHARQLIEPLRAGLELLRSDPER